MNGSTKKAPSTPTPYAKAGARPEPQKPRPSGGVFWLGVERLAVLRRKALLEVPELAGPSRRDKWAYLEPTEGRYDWTDLDECVDQVERAGKRVMLRVLAGASSPDWLIDQLPAEHVLQYVADDGTEARMPAPWDETYLDYWARFVRVFASRYRNRACVVLVANTGPAEAGEPHLPCKADEVAWKAMGYTPGDLIWAWGRIHAEFAAAWRGKVTLTQALAHPLGAWSQPQTVLEAIERSALAHGMRCCIQWLDGGTVLTTELMRRLFLHRDEGGTIGFQALCPYGPRFKGSLDQMVDIALSAGAWHVEVYPGDVDHPAIARLAAGLPQG